MTFPKTHDSTSMAQRRKSWLGVGVKAGLKKLGKIRARRTKERQKEGAGRHELVENRVPSPGVPLAPSLTVVTTAATTTIKILNRKKKRNWSSRWRRIIIIVSFCENYKIMSWERFFYYSCVRARDDRSTPTMTKIIGAWRTMAPAWSSYYK